MSNTSWDERFFTSTRGQIVNLLRRRDRTVDELAQVLGLTDNAIRAHLTTLERDDLVKQGGLRRGTGKPAYVYELTPAAERLFPKADAPLLRLLLDVLAERLPAAEVDAVMREVGERAAGADGSGQALQPRVERAVSLLNELGGLAEYEAGNDGFVIQGYGCPFAAAMAGHPEVCRLAAAVLTAAIGAPVCECCTMGERPRCCFEVRALAADAAGHH